ncbi:MAG: DNA-3-methyladenine glycosylase [Acidobacteriota bacterium]
MKSRSVCGTILDRSFFCRPTKMVARGLLGQVSVHGDLCAEIRETEAYLPVGDEAAHAVAGQTRRTRILFGPAGHAYVYLNYGMHHLFNVVAEVEGIPGCVLIRAAGPWKGPGRLSRGMGIDLRHYGVDLTQGPLRIERGRNIEEENVLVRPRVGIRRSSELFLRFLIA